MPMSTPFDATEALAHLRAADPAMARIVDAIGPYSMRADPEDPFRSLARAIIFQQLSGKAAGTIFRRFVALFDSPGDETALVSRSDPDWSPAEGPFPMPTQVLGKDEETLRSAGLSRNKALSIQDLAKHFASGELATEAFDHWEDEEIIAHLTRVRGIGRWTAEMFLMFHLARPNVLPVNDVGINRAIMRQYGLEALPGPADVQRIGARWRPYASVACWYLWRTEDVQLPANTGAEAAR